MDYRYVSTEISQDATEFMSVEENEDVKEELKNYCYNYVVDGKRLFGISKQS